MSAQRSRSRHLMRALAGGAVALSALGCAGPAAVEHGAERASGVPAAQVPRDPAADVENLRERAAAFWAARMTIDANKQWELLEPRGRGRLTVAEYGGVPRAVKYLAYQVEEARVNGYFATVKVRLIVQPVLPTASQRPVPPSAVVIDDKWVRIRGTWYRALEQEDRGGAVAAQR